MYAQYLMDVKSTGRQYPVYVNSANDKGRVCIVSVKNLRKGLKDLDKNISCKTTFSRFYYIV